MQRGFRETTLVVKRSKSGRPIKKQVTNIVRSGSPIASSSGPGGVQEPVQVPPPATGLQDNLAFDAPEDILFEDSGEPVPPPKRTGKVCQRFGSSCGKKLIRSFALQSHFDFQRDFLDDRDPYLTALLAAEAPPSDGVATCGHAVEWRCSTCHGRPTYCTQCCREAHRSNPLHRIQRWEGLFFKRAWLRDVGLQLHCGHGGKRCPQLKRYGVGREARNNMPKRSSDTCPDALTHNGATPPADDIPTSMQLDEEPPESPPELRAGTSGPSLDVPPDAPPSDGEAEDASTYLELDEEPQEPPLSAYRNNVDLLNEEEDGPSADDMDSTDLRGHAPLAPDLKSSASELYDNDRMITFVDTSGVHQLSVTFCKCRHAPRHDMQLLALGYYPASRRRTRTAFTFACLDDFLLTNKECKAAPFSYYQKLCRSTDNVCPDSTPVSTPSRE